MVNEMNDMNQISIHEHVSALADGQLQGDELERVANVLCTQDELREHWQMWHLVGDVLRSGQHVQCTDTSRFVANLRQRLADEPVPKQSATVPTAVAVSKNSAPLRVEAANEPVFRWKMIAGVASIAAAAAIGWNWIGAGAASPAGSQLAQQQQQQRQAPTGSLLTAAPASGTIAPTQVVVGNGNTNAPQIMLRDARLDQMLQAHQQAGGSSQMPSGFLRNATFESPSR